MRQLKRSNPPGGACSGRLVPLADGSTKKNDYSFLRRTVDQLLPSVETSVGCSDGDGDGVSARAANAGVQTRERPNLESGRAVLDVVLRQPPPD